MKDINYHYTEKDESFEIDWREMPIRNRLKLIYLLLTNQKINIIGNNKHHYINCTKDVVEEKK